MIKDAFGRFLQIAQDLYYSGTVWL